MAILRVITFFIRAIAGAMASMLRAVFTHLLPAVAVLAVVVVAAAVSASCGVGGLALLRRRRGGNS